MREWDIRFDEHGYAIAITKDGEDALHLNPASERNVAHVSSIVTRLNLYAVAPAGLEGAEVKRDRRNELHRRLQRTEAALLAYRRAADPDVLDQIHRSGGSFGRAMLLATIRAQEVEIAEERALNAELRNKLDRAVEMLLLEAVEDEKRKILAELREVQGE